MNARIAKTEVLQLRHPVVTPTGPAAVTYSHRESLIVRLEDGDGLVGWGETYTAPGLAAVARAVGSMLEGKVAADSRGLLDLLWETCVDSMVVSAWSIAIDDLRARQLGVSVAQLYGGSRRKKVRAYASSGGYRNGFEPEEGWLADVKYAKDNGFTACKLRIGRYHPRRELAGLREVRAAVDPSIDLMVDANGAYSVPLAIEVGRGLEALGFCWFEEPLIRFRAGMSYPGYELLSALDIPIAAGEGLQSRGAFAAFLDRKAADIIQPDVAICGGVGEGLFIAEMAALSGVPCVPHAWGGAILLAATIAFLSLIPESSELVGPSSPLLEFDLFENRMRTEIAGDALQAIDGYVTVPVSPGLGIEIDERALRSLVDMEAK